MVAVDVLHRIGRRNFASANDWLCVSDEEFQAAAPAVVQHESTLKRHSSLPLAENKYASFLMSAKQAHGSVNSGIEDFKTKAKAFPPASGTGVPNFPSTVDYDEPCGETYMLLF